MKENKTERILPWPIDICRIVSVPPT